MSSGAHRLMKQLSKRLRDQEREAVRLRKGTVTSVAPLTVEVGASGVEFENVSAVGFFEVGDNVAILTLDSGKLIL